jgi:serine/threonine-protein kinase
MAVLRRVSDDQPRPVESLNADVPPWLASIIEKLHAKNPDDRFQSATEVAELLSQCLAHVQQPLAHAIPPHLQVNPKPMMRRKAIQGGLIAASLTVFFGLGMAAFLNWTPLVRSLGLSQDTSESSSQRDSEEKSESIEVKLDEARARTQALENDLWQPTPSGRNDPAEALLQEARLSIERLKRELSASRPEF